jgi:hypothetical protein
VETPYFGDARGEAVNVLACTSGRCGYCVACTERADERREPYGREYRAGAAVAFGLMGMAQAIYDREADKVWLAAEIAADEVNARMRRASDDRSDGTP